MEGVNGNQDDGVRNSPTKVDFHLKNLLASHLSNPDLTPEEVAEASTSSAAAAAIAAKAARATANEKAAAAAKAVAAAKSALDLFASFPRGDHVAPNSLLGVMPNSSSIPKRVDFSDLGMVLDSDRPGGQGAQEASQATRKRGRPKSK